MNGEQIENFKGSMETLSGWKMNCECAMARTHLEDNKPKCCPNGNYESMQCVGGLCYCVDEYGRQTSDEVDQILSNELNCSDYCCESDDVPPYAPDDWCYDSKFADQLGNMQLSS